jgi:hypothetical protein
MAEHGLDHLQVSAADQGEDSSAMPEVVEPDRRQALPADKPGKPARQVSGRVGTAGRAGENVPVARHGRLPGAVGGKDLQGPGIERQDVVAGDGSWAAAAPARGWFPAAAD